MGDRYALDVNDVVVSQVHDGHHLFIVTADPNDRLSLLCLGHQWSVPYAVARGASLTGRKGGHLCTTDDATFDYLDTFRSDPSGVASDSDPNTPRPQASRGRSETELIDTVGVARPLRVDGFLLGQHGSDAP